MIIEYEAVYGNGFYYNLRRVHNNVYRADIAHNTSFGWLIEEDILSHLKPEYFKKGKLELKKGDMASEEEIAICLIGSIIDRFPNALTK